MTTRSVIRRYQSPSQKESPMGGELGKSLVRTAARSSRATAIEGLGAQTSRVVSSARQFQSHLTPEPLHWLVDSPDPVHSGNPNDRAGRSAQQHRTRAKGAGLGLPFAVALVEQTRVPIGLAACAHGSTSMEQWNPAKKNEGGNSLYGSMLRQVQLAGGKVKGVLWYQGESDAMGSDAWKIYHRVFADFIASVRADLNQPDLPFYYVQIGRFINGTDPRGWNAVQEVQRRLPERVPNTAVVSVIDLELDDSFHVGTHGLKRAGARLARIAERELFGQIGATTFETDMTKIIQAGLAAIPSDSQYHECISDVLAWHKEKPQDWQATWSRINDKYHKNLEYRRFSCSKNETPPYKLNIDAKLNGAYVVMGLLYGNGDPDRTITIATRCGQDSDCNPANAAGILFTTIGYSRLPERFTLGLDTTTKFNSTPYTFPQLIAVCEQLGDEVVHQAGGRIDKSADGHETFVIPVQTPRPSALASCWNPGPQAESRFSPQEMKQIHAVEK